MNYERDINDIIIMGYSREFHEDLKNREYYEHVLDCIYNFRGVYHDTFIWTKTKYFGIETLKFPTDMWLLQEMINEIRPSLFIETGTWYGGTALYCAHLFDALGNGKVITIDNDKKENLPVHPRIEYITGDCLSEEVIVRVKANMNGGETIVNLDSCHNKDHVLKELEVYSSFVSQKGYLIVDDTILGHPVKIEDKSGKLIFPGPMEAVMEFVSKHDEFEIDKYKEKFLLTSNPNGYLKRKNA